MTKATKQMDKGFASISFKLDNKGHIPSTQLARLRKRLSSEQISNLMTFLESEDPKRKKLFGLEIRKNGTLKYNYT
jgi:hypothetical protein